MKTIRVPATVTLTDSGKPVLDAQGQPASISFVQFVENTLLADAAWGKDLAGIRLSARISVAVNKPDVVDGASFVKLDDVAHSKLVEVMSSPSNPYHPLVARQLMPFFDAIENAEETP